MTVIEDVTESGVRTRDLGGDKGTDDVTEAVCDGIRKRA